MDKLFNNLEDLLNFKYSSLLNLFNYSFYVIVDFSSYNEILPNGSYLEIKIMTNSRGCEKKLNLYELLLDKDLVDEFKKELGLIIHKYSLEIRPYSLFYDDNDITIIKFKYLYNTYSKGIINETYLYNEYKSESDPLYKELKGLNSVIKYELKDYKKNGGYSKILNEVFRLDNIEKIYKNDDKLIIKNLGYVIKISEWKNEGKLLFHEGYISRELHKLKYNSNFNKSLDVLFFNNLEFNLSNSEVYMKNGVILITEYIDGISLKEFMKTCGYIDLINVLVQIFYSLYHANKKLKFVHFDLHKNNIKIEIKDEEVEIKYEEFTIKTKYLVKIFDFEYSHIKKHRIESIGSSNGSESNRSSNGSESTRSTASSNGSESNRSDESIKIIDNEDITKTEQSDYIEDDDYDGVDLGIDSYSINVYNKNFWVHDVFKLLMNLYKIVRKHRKYYVDLITNLLSYFIGKNIDNIIFNRYSKINEYFNLRYSEKFDNMNYEDFLDFFNKQLYKWLNITTSNEEDHQLVDYICDYVCD